MAKSGWIKRPAFMAFVIVLICLILVLIRIHMYAWPWLASKPEHKVKATEGAWNMALMINMRAHLETICLPHAEVLLTAETRLAGGQSRGQIMKDLSTSSGVKAAIISELGGEIYQYPVGAYQVEDLQSQIEDFEEEAMWYPHPILRRRVSGLTRFVKWRAGGDSLDILVRYAEAPGAEKKVLGLVFDAKWILDQVLAVMDSVTREDPLLLFWSVPKEGLAEQTIGITYQGDTLWWDENSSLETLGYRQPAGLIEGMFVHARYHWISEENSNAKRMPGIGAYFILAEILFILLVILALFAIRTKSQ
jgi:hypothetical protein